MDLHFCEGASKQTSFRAQSYHTQDHPLPNTSCCAPIIKEIALMKRGLCLYPFFKTLLSKQLHPWASHEVGPLKGLLIWTKIQYSNWLPYQHVRSHCLGPCYEVFIMNHSCWNFFQLSLSKVTTFPTSRFRVVYRLHLKQTQRPKKDAKI